MERIVLKLDPGRKGRGSPAEAQPVQFLGVIIVSLTKGKDCGVCLPRSTPNPHLRAP